MDAEKKELADPTATPGDESAGTQLTEDPKEAQPAEEHEWVANSLSLPREALFVFVVCMAQFCTREYKSWKLNQKRETSLTCIFL